MEITCSSPGIQVSKKQSVSSLLTRKDSSFEAVLIYLTHHGGDRFLNQRLTSKAVPHTENLNNFNGCRPIKTVADPGIAKRGGGGRSANLKI